LHWLHAFSRQEFRRGVDRSTTLALIELKQKELIRHVSPNTTPGKKISAVVLGGINPEGKLLKILT
jgi:hypothetical protein